MCVRPWPCTPTQATRIVSLGLGLAPCAPAAAANDPIRKCLRSMHSLYSRLVQSDQTGSLGLAAEEGVDCQHMSEKQHREVVKNEPAEKASTGATRREMFQIG